MSTYTGRLEMTGVVDRPIDIRIDLDGDSLAISTFDGDEVGAWGRELVQITGLEDGFTFKINGIPAWVRTDDDGAFATEIGLRWAPPRLRRLMAVHQRALAQPA